MPSDGTIAGALIHGLAKRSTQGLNNKEAKVRDQIRSLIVGRSGRPIPEHGSQTTRSLLNRLGKSDINLSVGSVPGTFIALRPIAKSDLLLPYLSVAASADLSQFQLVLLVFTIDGSDSAGAFDSLRSIGFRFESPEASGEPGRHNYWHMQLTSNLASDSEFLKDTTLTWLPTSTPAIPLNAQNAATCVVNLAMALYGGLVAADLVDDLEKPYSKETVCSLKSQIKSLSVK